MITIGIDPEVELGPFALSWHGTMIAVGISVGALVARRWARDRGLRSEEILSLVGLIALAGIVGARAFYLLENDPGALLRPAEWPGTRGFSFYGQSCSVFPRWRYICADAA